MDLGTVMLAHYAIARRCVGVICGWLAMRFACLVFGVGDLSMETLRCLLLQYQSTEPPLPFKNNLQALVSGCIYSTRRYKAPNCKVASRAVQGSEIPRSS